MDILKKLKMVMFVKVVVDHIQEKIIYKDIKKCDGTFTMSEKYESLKEAYQHLQKNRVIEKKFYNIQNIQQQNNVQQNVQINAFGKENLSYITPKMIKECIKKPVTGIVRLIETIHFNKDHPENHNVCIKNLNSNYAQIHNGDKWILEKEAVINKLVDKKSEIMEEYFDEHEEIFSGAQGGRYKRFPK